eukprot:3411955-Rhodomonas_salina.1
MRGTLAARHLCRRNLEGRRCKGHQAARRNQAYIRNFPVRRFPLSSSSCRLGTGYNPDRHRWSCTCSTDTARTPCHSSDTPPDTRNPSLRCYLRVSCETLGTRGTP